MQFQPRNATRKRGLCRVHLSVCLSIRHSFTWVEVIVKLLFDSIAPSFAFLISSAGIQFQEKPFL